MEAFGLYLLKSAVWLTGFAIVFLLFLRNERYFQLKRIFLLSGIFAAVVFPFYSWHYAVMLPSLPAAGISIPEIADQKTISTSFTPAQSPILYLWLIYIAGIVCLALRLIWQTGKITGKVFKNGYVKNGPIKVVRSSEYSSSFSFFSFVFVNPSTPDIEMKEILNHERGHIQKRHWFDLLLLELLCMLQWFNPFVWIYANFVRQNHEYLADETALQHTADPAIYKATLLNQMIGVPVISLANSFNYSLNKKRFNMMKKKIDSPFRKLKMLMVLPFIALVFYAFAKPEYIEASPSPKGNLNVVSKEGTVKGKVTTADGKPLSSATVIIKGTTTGTITDADGIFMLKNVSEDAKLQISYVGLKTVEIKPDFNQNMIVKMGISTQVLQKIVVQGLKEDRSTQSSDIKKVRIIDENNPPLFIVDGKEIGKDEFNKLNPDDFVSISVLKNESSVATWGEKGKNGVILITSKKNIDTSDKKSEEIKVTGYGEQKKQSTDPSNPIKLAYTVIEQMPQFPGGEKALAMYLRDHMKYPVLAQEDKKEGTVVVNFSVSSTGKITRAKVVKSVHPALDTEAIRIVESMPDWRPGSQNGTPVDVSYSMPIEFALK